MSSAALKAIGELADRIRALEMQADEIQANVLTTSGLGFHEGETLTDVCKRGGLVPELPTLSPEKRNDEAPQAWRLIFPQHDGARARIYLGSGEMAESKGRAVIDLKERYDTAHQRMDTLDRALQNATQEIRNVLSKLKGV
ncbi:MAG: hypothetical protein V2A79_19910 [Planctomycetota bacterium]